MRWNRDGRVTFLNEFGLKFFGFTAEEIIGQHVVGTIVPATESTERDLRPLMDWILADPKSFEHNVNENVRRNGERVWIAWNNQTVLDDQGQILEVFSVGHDITEHRPHELEIEQLNRLYLVSSQISHILLRERSRDRLLQEICRVIVELGRFKMAWIGWHDPASGRVVPAACCGDDLHYLDQIRVYADDRPEGRGPTGIAIRENRPYISNDFANDPQTSLWQELAALQGFRASASFPIRLLNQACGALTIYAREPNFFGNKEVAQLEEVATDISLALEIIRNEGERREAERALHESELKHRLLFETANAAILLMRDGHVVECNAHTLSMFGCSRKQIVGERPSSFSPPSQPDGRVSGEAAQERLQRALAGEPQSFEWEHRRLDGTLFMTEVSLNCIQLGKEPLLQVIIRDIAERKRVEVELDKYRERLEEMVRERTAELAVARDCAQAADRLKSAFLATMSHELRTPLNSIIGFTGIVLQGLAGPLNAEQTKQLEMVRGSARHLLALINDVLDISKIEAGQLDVRSEPFDMRASLLKVLGSVKPLAQKKGLALNVELAPEIGTLVSDPRRVEQVILNLLNNAIKFTEQGAVTLTAGSAPGPPSKLSISVADTGIGIKREDLGQLFEPFRQIDSGLTRQHEGTGLGLAICRRLAEMLGGEIGVTSEWGKGSVFTVTLPGKL